MTCRDWRELYEELADKYFEATGELAPAPNNPSTGKPLSVILVSPKRLEQWYTEEGMRLREIGTLLCCSASTVSNLLRRAGIPTRTSAQYPKTEAQREAARQNCIAYHARHPAKGKKETGLTMHERRLRMGHEFGGAERKGSGGYIWVYAPEHPRANRAHEVPKHTLVMERHLGRYLEDDEVVHHINHIRDDNRIENLELMNVSDHLRMHGREVSATKGSREAEEGTSVGS